MLLLAKLRNQIASVKTLTLFRCKNNLLRVKFIQFCYFWNNLDFKVQPRFSKWKRFRLCCQTIFILIYVFGQFCTFLLELDLINCSNNISNSDICKNILFEFKLYKLVWSVSEIKFKFKSFGNTDGTKVPSLPAEHDISMT